MSKWSYLSMVDSNSGRSKQTAAEMTGWRAVTCCSRPIGKEPERVPAITKSTQSLVPNPPKHTQAPKVQLLCDVLFSLLGVVAWIKDATSTARSSWFFESSSIVTSPGFRWITEAIWKRRSWALTTPWQDNKRRTWCCTRTYSRW